MIHSKTIACVVMARGGSKGLSHKNLRDLRGKPLVYYPLRAATLSNLYDRVELNSECPDIRKVAKEHGFRCQYVRPKRLASDTALASDAMAHYLRWLERNDKKYDYVQLLQPTSPLLGPKYLNMGVRTIVENPDYDMVLSVQRTTAPYGVVRKLPDDMSLREFFPPQVRRKNRQEVEDMYQLFGGIYIAKWDVWYHGMDWFSCNTHAIELPKRICVDIDDEVDLNVAQALYQQEWEE